MSSFFPDNGNSTPAASSRWTTRTFESPNLQGGQQFGLANNQVGGSGGGGWGGNNGCFIPQHQQLQQSAFPSENFSYLTTPSPNYPWNDSGSSGSGSTHHGSGARTDEGMINSYPAWPFSSPQKEQSSDVPTDDEMIIGYDEEGNKILLPPPPPGFGSPIVPNSSSSSVITNEMLKQLEERLLAMIEDTPEKINARVSHSSPLHRPSAAPARMTTTPSYVGTDPITVAGFLDCILFTLQNRLSSTSNQSDYRRGEGGSPSGAAAGHYANVANPVGSFTECLNKDMKDQYALCLGNVMKGEEMTTLLGAMNYAYFGPHQISNGFSAVLPGHSLYFWSQVSYGFLEAMISMSPEFFYSIPWKEYACNPEFSNESYKKLSTLAAEKRNLQSPKRGSRDASVDEVSDTSPFKRFKSPNSPLSPPARVRVYDPVHNAYVYECVFCKGNDQPERMYKSHPIRVGDTVICPLLRKHKCRLCGATDDNAHTIKYCPENTKGFFASHPSVANRGQAEGMLLNNSTGAKDENAGFCAESGTNAFGSRQLTPTHAAWTKSTGAEGENTRFCFESGSSGYGSRQLTPTHAAWTKSTGAEGENARFCFESGSNASGSRQLTPTHAAWSKSIFRQSKPPVVRKLNFDIPSDTELSARRKSQNNY